MRGKCLRWAQRPLPSMMTATCCGRRFKSILSRHDVSSALAGFKRSLAFTRVRSKDRQPEKLTHAGVTRKARAAVKYKFPITALHQDQGSLAPGNLRRRTGCVLVGAVGNSPQKHACSAWNF